MDWTPEADARLRFLAQARRYDWGDVSTAMRAATGIHIDAIDCRSRFAALEVGKMDAGDDGDEDDLLDLLDDEDDVAPGAPTTHTAVASTVGDISSVPNTTGTGKQLGGRVLAAVSDFEFDVEAAIRGGDDEMTRVLDHALGTSRIDASASSAGLGGSEASSRATSGAAGVSGTVTASSSTETGRELLERIESERADRLARHAAARRDVFDRVAESVGATASPSQTRATAAEVRRELGLRGSATVTDGEDLSSGAVGGSSAAGQGESAEGSAGPAGYRVVMEPQGSTYWSSDRAQTRLERPAGMRGAAAEEDSAAIPSAGVATGEQESTLLDGAESDSDSFADDEDADDITAQVDGATPGADFLASLPAGAAIRDTPLGLQISMAAEAAEAAARAQRSITRQQGARMAAAAATAITSSSTTSSGTGIMLGLDEDLERLLTVGDVPVRPTAAPMTPLGEVLAMLSGGGMSTSRARAQQAAIVASDGDDDDDGEEVINASTRADLKHGTGSGQGQSTAVGMSSASGGVTAMSAIGAASSSIGDDIGDADAVGGSSVHQTAITAPVSDDDQDEEADDDDDEMSDSEWEARLEAAAERRAAEAEAADAAKLAVSMVEQEASAALEEGTIDGSEPISTGWQSSIGEAVGGGEEESKEPLPEDIIDAPSITTTRPTTARPLIPITGTVAVSPPIAPPAVVRTEAETVTPSMTSIVSVTRDVVGERHAMASLITARKHAEEAAKEHGEGPVSLSSYHHAVSTAGWCPALDSEAVEASAEETVALMIGFGSDLCAQGVLTAAGDLAAACLLQGKGMHETETIAVLGGCLTVPGAVASVFGASSDSASCERCVVLVIECESAATAAGWARRVSSSAFLRVATDDAQTEVCCRMLFGPFAFRMERIASAASKAGSGVFGSACGSQWARAAAAVAAGEHSVAIAFPGQGIASESSSVVDASASDSDVSVAALADLIGSIREAGLYVAGLRLAYPGAAAGSLLTAPDSWHDVVSTAAASAPAIAVLVRGRDVASKLAELIGPSNQRAAAITGVRTLRGRLGCRAVEVPATAEAAEREAMWWFGGRLQPASRGEGDCSGAHIERTAPLYSSERGSDLHWAGWEGHITPKARRLPLAAIAPPSVAHVVVTAAPLPQSGPLLGRPIPLRPDQTALCAALENLSAERLGILAISQGTSDAPVASAAASVGLPSGTACAGSGCSFTVSVIGEAASARAVMALRDGFKPSTSTSSTSSSTRSTLLHSAAATATTTPERSDDGCPFLAWKVEQPHVTAAPDPSQSDVQADAKAASSLVRELWAAASAQLDAEDSTMKDTTSFELRGCVDDDVRSEGAALVIITQDSLLPGGEAISHAAPAAVLDPSSTQLSSGLPLSLPPWLEAHTPRRSAPIAALLSAILDDGDDSNAWAPSRGRPTTISGTAAGTIGSSSPQRSSAGSDRPGNADESVSCALIACQSFPAGLPATTAAGLTEILAGPTQPMPTLRTGGELESLLPRSARSPAERAGWWFSLLQWHLTERPVIAVLVSGPEAAAAISARVGPMGWAAITRAKADHKAASRAGKSNIDARRSRLLVTSAARQSLSSSTASSSGVTAARAAAAATSFHAEYAVDPLRTGAMAITAPASVARAAVSIFGRELVAIAAKRYAASIAGEGVWADCLHCQQPSDLPFPLLCHLAPPSLSSWSYAVCVIKPHALCDTGSGAVGKALRLWSRAGVRIDAIRAMNLTGEQAATLARHDTWAVKESLRASTGLKLSEDSAVPALEAAIHASYRSGHCVAMLLAGPFALEEALSLLGPPLYAASDSGCFTAVRAVVEREWAMQRPSAGAAQNAAFFASARSDRLMSAIKASYYAACGTGSHGRMGLRTLLGKSCVEDAVRSSPTAYSAQDEASSLFPDLAPSLRLRATWHVSSQAATSVASASPSAGSSPELTERALATAGSAEDVWVKSCETIIETVSESPAAAAAAAAAVASVPRPPITSIADIETTVLVIAPSVIAPMLQPDDHAGRHVRITRLRTGASAASASLIEGVRDVLAAPREHTEWQAASAIGPNILEALTRDGFAIAGIKVIVLSSLAARRFVAAATADGNRTASLSSAADRLSEGPCLAIAACRREALSRLRLSMAGAQFDPKPLQQHQRQHHGRTASSARGAASSAMPGLPMRSMGSSHSGVNRLGEAAGAVTLYSRSETAARNWLACLFTPDELCAGGWRLQHTAAQE